MSKAPELLLTHHLKTLRLPTFLREHDKQARICAAEPSPAIWPLIILKR